MITKKEEIVKLLLDIKYGGSRNEFEEFYGDAVSYQEIEQESYQDLKMMVEGEVGTVKFRKARDISGAYFLTCKLEMEPKQYEIFISIIEDPEGDIIYKRFKFLHDFIISNVRFQTDEELSGDLLSDGYQKDIKTKNDFEVISLDEFKIDVEDKSSEYNEEDYE